jgi:hypothetical protein
MAEKMSVSFAEVLKTDDDAKYRQQHLDYLVKGAEIAKADNYAMVRIFFEDHDERTQLAARVVFAISEWVYNQDSEEVKKFAVLGAYEYTK